MPVMLQRLLALLSPSKTRTELGGRGLALHTGAGWHVFQLLVDDATVFAYSPVDPVLAMQIGLNGEAIAGTAPNADGGFAAFRPHAPFLRALHEVVTQFGSDDPQAIAVAHSQRSGWLYIVDQRAAADQAAGRAIPSEDILGGFTLDEGRIVSTSYQSNQNYRILTEKGFVQLPPRLAAALTTRISHPPTV
jgi:hypothetical protein